MQHAAIEYEPRSSHRSRRVRRRVVRFGIVTLVLIVGFVACRHGVLKHIEWLWIQYQCVNYRDTSSLPVFVYDVGDKSLDSFLSISTKRLMHLHRFTAYPSMLSAAGRSPHCVNKLVTYVGGLETGVMTAGGKTVVPGPEATVFVGSLRSPSGQSRVVVINLVNVAAMPPRFHAMIFRRHFLMGPTLVRSALVSSDDLVEEVIFDYGQGTGLEIWLGNADPAAADTFRMKVRVGDDAGVLVGRLTDTDHIILHIEGLQWRGYVSKPLPYPGVGR